MQELDYMTFKVPSKKKKKVPSSSAILWFVFEYSESKCSLKCDIKYDTDF